MLLSIDFDDLISICFIRLVSIEKIYPTLQTVFHQLSKHLEFRQLSSWCLDIAIILMFDMLLESEAVYPYSLLF